MTTDVDLRAFDALGKSARLGDLVAITRAVAQSALTTKRVAWEDAARVAELARQTNLTHEEATTPFGDALAVLERGPSDDAERGLACALMAHALAELPPKGREDEDRAASELLWLAANTPFDATGLLDRALGDAAADLWDAIADRVRRFDQGRGDHAKHEGIDRGGALVGALALATSTSDSAKRHVAALSVEARDPKLRRALVGGGAAAATDETIAGEMASAPRRPWTTAVLAVFGILLAVHAVRFFARIALAYRRPAEVLLSATAVRIRYKTQLLGRTFRDREVVIQRTGLVRATREVRYPGAAFYAGLFALAIGSYFGVATFVDGVRAASPSLLAVGLLVVAAGIGVDFVLASIAPGARGRCRVLFVPRDGRAVCVGDVDRTRVDAALSRIAQAV